MREVRVIPAPRGGPEQAVCAGARQANGQLIVCAPADGALRPGELMKLTAPLQAAPAIVLGCGRKGAPGMLPRLVRCRL